MQVTHVAQAGGAAAVVLSHTDDLLMMSGSGQEDEAEPAIPSLLLSHSDGLRLVMALEQEREDVRLTATLRPLPDEVRVLLLRVRWVLADWHCLWKQCRE